VRFNRRPTGLVILKKPYIDKSCIRKEIKCCDWRKYTFGTVSFAKILNILGKYKYKWTINIMCDNWYRVTYAGADGACCGTFDPIDRVFHWTSTPEGHRFWSEIHDEYLWHTDTT